MIELYNLILLQPLLNLLVWLYGAIPGADLGFAIIALTVIVKLALWPLTHQSLKSQKALQQLQPKLDALKKEHADDKEALAKAMMELYQSEKVNPLSSCLPILVQLPIIFALYGAFRLGIGEISADQLYSFVANPGEINHIFLGVLDLAEKSIPLALIAGAFQFVQTKMLMARRAPKGLRKKEGAKDEDMLAAMNTSMTYFMPIITVVIGATLPSGLTLYWATTNLIAIIQQLIAFRGKDSAPAPVKEEAGA